MCREHGITAKLTKLSSPTTIGKIERWHQTPRGEPLDVAGPFADLLSAQAAITAWVHAYNHQRQPARAGAGATRRAVGGGGRVRHGGLVAVQLTRVISGTHGY